MIYCYEHFAFERQIRGDFAAILRSAGRYGEPSALCCKLRLQRERGAEHRAPAGGGVPGRAGAKQPQTI